MLEEGFGAGNCTVLLVAAGLSDLLLELSVLLLLLLPQLLLLLIMLLQVTGRNKLDLITTVLGGKEAVDAAISAPLTGETRTMRIAPPCPGTLTSFTGTILAPGLSCVS
jgi:hypothetical protein